jgi:8-amino-7-oxononanoate synthase
VLAAVAHLRTGQCELARAGGVYLNLMPDILVGFSRIGALSRSGACRPFDRRADGFVLGEGAGLVVLKRLADAERDGDRVYAVIRGSACTNDGRSTGPMTPSRAGQAACLARAYKDADVPPHSVGFVECHGTATSVGDAVELEALGEVWAGREEPCQISSAKANIGHTMSAAGIAGLIKAALAVHHGAIPPQPGCEQPRSALAGDGRLFSIAAELLPWTERPGGLRRAGVSAFGFGGTNVHVVLEQAPEQAAPGTPGETPLCLVTAGSASLLAAHADRLAHVLSGPDSPRPKDVAHTLALRTPLDARAVVSAGSRQELVDRLTGLAGALRDGAATPQGVWLPDRGPMPVDVRRLLAGVEPAPATGRQVSLPASPVQAEPYWGLERSAPQQTHDPAAVAERLLAVVSRVADYPPGVVHLDQRFINDLGFDSLLVAELAEQLEITWPDLPPLTRDLLRPATTVRAVADLISQAAAEPQRVHDPHCPEPAPEPGDLAAHLRQLGLPSPYFAVHDELEGPTALVDGVRMTTFSSYDYLGLARDPVVTVASKQAIDRYGTSASASRAASGELPIHGALETALAGHLGAERALVLVSGHATNVAVLGQLLGPGDLIVHDALAHNSLLQGARFSGARRREFPHNDMAALDRLLAAERSRHRRVLVAVEGVYSMDGDLADLPSLVELRRRHDVLLYLDEAHSIGVLGETGAGAVEHWGLGGGDVDIRIGTLSKALAGCGGYVAGADETIIMLRHTTPGFLYSVGMPPGTAAAALAALGRLREDPQLARTARDRASLFRVLAREAGLDTGLSADGSAIVPIVTGDAATALRLADRMRCRRIDVQPFVPPAIETHQSRLRFFLTAQHSEQDIRETVHVLAVELATLAGRTALGTPLPRQQVGESFAESHRGNET